AAIDYGSVFVGAARPETLEVRNAGTDLLSVSGLASSRGEYTVDPAGAFTLAPRASRVAIGTFQPGAAGSAPGTLTVSSNDPDEPQLVVSLAGTGVLPPDIGVAPESLSVSLAADDSTTRTITISNTGPTDLDWRLTVHGTPRDSLAANSPTSSAD